ncbi:fibronectin type III domain-containing protein [Actinomadura yumaensis]
MCVYPLIPDGKLTVNAKVDYPAEIPLNTYAPEIKITSHTVVAADTIEGMQSVRGLETIEGTAIANSTLKVPEYPDGVKARVPLGVPKTKVPRTVPAPELPMDVEGSAPALVYTKAGTGSMDVNNITLNIIPRDAQGNIVEDLLDPEYPDRNYFEAPCTLTPADQDNRIVNFKIGEGTDPGDTTAPSAPANLTSPSKTASSVKLDWDDATDNEGGTGVGGYNVYQNGQKVKTVTSSDAEITGLSPKTEYAFTVKAFDKATPTANESGASNEVKVTTDDDAPPADTTAPSVPANVKATGKTTTTVTLDWDDSTDNEGGTGLGGYNVYQGGEKVATASTSEAVVSGLKPGTEYGFTVKAFDKATPTPNESKASDPVVTVKTDDDTPPADTTAPSVPANVKVTGKDSTSVSLAWDPSTDNEGGTGLGGYNVYQGGEKVATVGPTETAAKVTGLKPATEYAFTVKAFDKATPTANESKASEPELKVTTDDDTPPADTTAPSVPANVKATGKTTTTVTLDWDDSTDNEGGTGLGGYNVYQGGQKVATASSSTAVVSGLKPNTEYSFTVTAFDKASPANESKPSAEAKAKTDDDTPPADTTAPSVPANVKVSAKDKSSVTLNWDDSADNPGGTGVAGYNVYQDGKKVTTSATSDVKVTGLKAGTEYSFTVTAFDKATPANESKPSAAVKATTDADDPGTDFNFTYGLKGASKLKTLNGTVPLAGSIKGKVSGGKIAGDLTLNKSTGAFNLFGFLPITADVAFAPVGQTTGTESGANVSTTTKVNVKLPSIKVFGMEIGGGSSCQTTSPTEVKLTSTNWSRTAGGDLTGGYTLPSLGGCGFLTP